MADFKKAGVKFAEAFAQASREADAAMEAAKAADRAAAGRKAADVAKATGPMKMSEALGNMNIEGKGKLKVTQSDRTRVGGGNIGGAMFPGLQQVDPFYEGLVWGVGNKPTASGLIRQSDENTLWSTILGSADQLKTNPIVFNKLRRGFTDAMKEGKLNDELASKINKNLELKFGEGADIRDPKIWQKANTFEKRSLLADVMMGQGVDPSKGGVALGGEKSGKGVIFKPSEILKRETESLLLHPEHGGDVPTFAVGPRLFTLSGDVKNRPDLHPGFPFLLTGEDKGVVFRPAPGEIAMRDYATRFKGEKKRSPGYYDWTLGEKGKGLPSQDITEEYLTFLQKQGHKEGGKVDEKDYQARLDAMLAKATGMADGGAVSDYQKRLDAMIAKHMGKAEGGEIKRIQWKAEGGVIDNMTPDMTDSGSMNFGGQYAQGGAIKPMPWKAAGGGWAKAAKAIQKAATEAGAIKAPQTAEKELTTLQDAHTMLGDRVRAGVAEANKMMEGFDYKYDKGQRVFTKDSAAKNKAPYTIVGRTRVGNQVMYDTTGGGMKAIKDPETGKAKRTPYEPGYRVRYESGDDFQEFDIPASAIIGDVEMAQGGAAFKSLQFKAEGGGIKKMPWKAADGGKTPEEMMTPPPDTPSKMRLTAEILARMAKEQGKEEVASLKKPRALTDLINRGMIAPLVGAPVDLINMGLEGVDALRDLASGKRVENRLASEKPFLGSEQIKDVMNRFGVTSGEERPMMETGLSLVSPAGVVKGTAKTGQKATGALSKVNTELNKSGTLSVPLTEAKTATTGTPQGARYATKQEGPYFRVRPTALDTSKAKGSGIRETTGLPTEGPVGQGSGETGLGLPQRYSPEEVDRIVADPNLNEPLRIAQQYTRENLGTDFVAPDIPPSSLAKQSAIARTHELALSDSPEYKDAVFSAYARTMPDVLEQAGAKDYDDLMEKAYRQLAKETDAQFQALPFNFSYHRGGEGNYSGTRELLEDIHGNRHMYVYQGGDKHDFLNKVDDVTGLNENEKFRAVHDAMGHAIYGNEFGPLGEEKAWAIHQQMYSPLARLAMTAETRGQNSLVNYSPLNVNIKEEVAKLRELQVEARRRGDREGERIATEAIRDAFSGFQFAPQKSILLPPEFVDPKYRGGMPDYIQPLITPTPGTTTQSALTHFSHNPNLTVTDPTKYGTGIKGAEKARLEGTDNPIVPRTYFYAGEPGAVAPEPGLGVNRYRTESESLYDITADPLRFRPLARESNRVPFTSKYNAGMRSPDQELTDMERMIREYGYEGYINPQASKPAAVVYTPKPVERRRKGGLALAK